MRVVADTNAVLSGLLWQGPPRQVIDAARTGVITLHTSLFLLAELAEVIGRGKFAHRIQRSELSAAALVSDYRRLAGVVEPAPLNLPASRDPDDDHVLACAVAAKADIIVTGDDDLLVLGVFNGIAILRPADALARIAESQR